MKSRDIALFVSIQGILLGAAFMLSSGGANLENHASQTKPAQTQSWTHASQAGQPAARRMNLPDSDGFRQVGKADSVVDTLQRASQQRSWVF